jgi:hypothetical protein
MGVEIIVPNLEPQRLPNIGAVIDGGGLELELGSKRAPSTVSLDCTIIGWRIVGDAPGLISLDIYRATDLGSYPPNNADSIVGTAPPTIDVAAIAAEDMDVSDWDVVDLDAGDILEFAVLSVSDFTWVRLELFINAR